MKGFIKIRRGLEEHLVSGQLGFLEAGVYLAIHLQANYETGVWVGSAPRLLATAPRGTNLREVQRAIRWPHALSATRDHIVPRALGGRTELSNLRLAHANVTA